VSFELFLIAPTSKFSDRELICENQNRTLPESCPTESVLAVAHDALHVGATGRARSTELNEGMSAASKFLAKKETKKFFA
jgi:hypothetical protein